IPQSIFELNKSFGTDQFTGPFPTLSRWKNFFAGFFYRPQATENLYYDLVQDAHILDETPPAQLRSVQQEIFEARGKRWSEGIRGIRWLVNPTGKFIAGRNVDVFYADYALLMHDVDAIVRLVALQSHISLGDVAPDRVPAVLRASSGLN